MMKLRFSKHRPASESEICRLEEQLEFALPKDYREFLLSFDGAAPEDNSFKGDPTLSVQRFIPIAQIEVRCQNVDGFPEFGIPIAEAFGNLFYLSKKDLCMYYWDHEVETDKKVADLFSEFLDGLQPDDSCDVDLKPGQVISVWVDPDFMPEWD